jgi:hypothetical protein
MLSSMSWKLVSFAFQLIILISIVVFFMVESSALRRAFPAGGEYEDVGDDDMHAGNERAHSSCHCQNNEIHAQFMFCSFLVY